MVFEVGQVWSCESDNKQHRAVIVSIDNFDSEEVIGIAVLEAESGDSPFLPLSKDAFTNSVISLLDSGFEIDAYLEGYQYWKELYLDGDAGVYKITVDEVV